MKEEGSTGVEASTFAGTGGIAAPSVTPLDIQNKEFRTSRMGGYRMKEVDEFLDEVTEAMGARIAENERLRAELGSTGGAAAPAGIEDDRPRSQGDGRAVRSYLIQERDFLRSLGSLVQEHAQRMKEMARTSRRDVPSPEAPLDGRADPEPGRSEPDREDAAAEATVTLSTGTAPGDDAAPVTIEDPQPVAAAPAEPRADSSLRELFWGEEG